MSEAKTKKLPDIIVRRHKANFVTIGFIGEISTRIDPGVTRITDQEVLKCIADPKLNQTWKAFLKNKVHELVTGQAEKEKGETTVFTAMKKDDALEIISQCWSIPALEQMYSDEQSKKGRKTIMDALQDQIKEVRKTPDKPAPETE